MAKRYGVRHAIRAEKEAVKLYLEKKVREREEDQAAAKMEHRLASRRWAALGRGIAEDLYLSSKILSRSEAYAEAVGYLKNES